MTIQVKFVGIDTWNRPVFKDDKKNFYGSTTHLYGYHDDVYADRGKLDSVLQDLVYFGKRFDCEPMGTPIRDQIEFIPTQGITKNIKQVQV